MSGCARFLAGAVLFARVGANLRNEPDGLIPWFSQFGTNCAGVKLSDSVFCETNPMSECVRFLTGAVLFARVGRICETNLMGGFHGFKRRPEQDAMV
jgi:hypothetical protein